VSNGHNKTEEDTHYRHRQQPNHQICNQIGDHQPIQPRIRVAAANLLQRSPVVVEMRAAAEHDREEEGNHPEGTDDDTDRRDDVEEIPRIHHEEAPVEVERAEFDEAVGGDHQDPCDPIHLIRVSVERLMKKEVISNQFHYSLLRGQPGQLRERRRVWRGGVAQRMGFDACQRTHLSIVKRK
jgi:hypothetical protein